MVATSTTYERTFKILYENVEDFKKLLERLNRKAVKLGVPPVSYAFLDTEVEHCDDGRVNIWRIYGISGKAPSLSDWEFVAAIEHGDLENLIYALSNKEGAVPEFYRSVAKVCDHCGYRRKRIHTYIVHNLVTDEWKQVGSGCLKDFLGLHTDPMAIGRWFDGLLDLEEKVRKYAKMPGALMAGGYHTRYGLEHYLRHTLTVLAGDNFNYVASKNTYNKMDTTGLRGWFCCPNPTPDVVSNKHWSDLETYFTYLKTAAPDTLSDYERNLLAVVVNGYVERNQACLAASALLASKRYAERLNRPVSPPRPVSEHIGDVGKRSTFNLKFTGVTHFDGYYGETACCRFLDGRGNNFVWFASNSPDFDDTEDRGKWYEVTGTVKKHGEYRGTKQTVLTRCKFSLNSSS